MSIIIRWKKLKEGDKLDWSREFKNGCMVAMVKRVGQIIIIIIIIGSDSNNFDQDRPNNDRKIVFIHQNQPVLISSTYLEDE
jgi:hypothetical protein